VIRAHVPESELYKYAASLRSMTQGRGSHSRKLASYDPAPDHVAQKVAEERRREHAEAAH
jgi:elongation factor G